MLTQKCFLLSSLKYGDHDAVLHCFTEESGFQSFFVRGIYSPKSKKKPYISPLNLLTVSTSEKTGDRMPFLKKMEQTPGEAEINDVHSYSVVLFIADFLNQILRNEQRNDSVFLEIEQFKNELSTGNFGSYIGFLIRFLKISGVAPLLSEEKYLDPETGNFCTEMSHTAFDSEISDMWKLFLKSQNPYVERISRSERNNLADSVMHYCHYHFTDFRTPKSLQVLREIFE